MVHWIQRDAIPPFGSAVIATVAHSDRDQEAATARLLAAAPKMLEALREIVAEQDARTPSQGTIYRDTGGMILARAAIAQAEEGGR
jgi:hypothetical protein